jgi:hypothetical protein
MNKRHEKYVRMMDTMKHNYDCKGNCRYQVQCALDAAWQELEECLLHEDRRRKLR